MKASLKQVYESLVSYEATLYNCEQQVEEVIIQNVCRDTRDVVANSLFVCIKGARVDGHDFALEAVKNGAVALLVSRKLEHVNVPQVIVPNTIKSLGLIAHWWRKQFRGKLIAITGSAGKTTLKECLASVLMSNNKSVARSKLNYNNQIGMPLSLLAASGNEDYWIMEAGISEAHDMDELGAILEPDFAVVLNVGSAHTEGLGKLGVAWHKSQLLKYTLKNSNYQAQAFVCADYADLVNKAFEIEKNICFFSGDAHAENANLAQYKAYYTGLVQSKEQVQGKYAVGYNEKYFEILSPFYGQYGAENVAAIAAICLELGLSEQEICAGFTKIVLPEQRFNTHNIGAWSVIDDSYNANALSMRRMLEAAVEQAANNPCYAVLGAMGELGDLAGIEHENLAKLIANLPISHVFWKGPYVHAVQNGLKQYGFNGSFILVDDAEDFGQKWANAKLKPGTVLCKGSRSNALEQCVSIILEKISDDNLRGGHVI